MSVRDGFDLNCGIKRATVLPQWANDSAAISTLQYRDVDGYPGMRIFHCVRLSADLSPSACARKFTDASAMSCVGCAIGIHHGGVAPDPAATKGVSTAPGEQQAKDAARWDHRGGLSCVRCERSAMTAQKFVGRFRLTRNNTLCVSCHAREGEVVAGRNSKGGPPTKWAHLRESAITLKVGGKRQRIEIGLRSGRPEVERYVARIYPDAKLLEVEIDGEIVEADAPVEPVEPVEVPAVIESQVKPSRKRVARRKPLPVATDAEALEAVPATQRASSNGRNWLPPLSTEEALEYEQSFEREDEPAVVWPFPRRAPAAAPVAEPLEPADDDLICDHWNSTADLVAFISEEWPDFEPVTPPAESAPVVSPSQPAKATTSPAVAPIRLFSKVLTRLGFDAGKLYSKSWMPLAVDVHRGPGKTTVLAGCLCGKTSIVNAKALLRGNVTCGGCNAPSAAPSFAKYLAQRPEPITIRGVLGNTHENAIAVGVSTYFRKFKKARK